MHVYIKAYMVLSGWQIDTEGHVDFQEELRSFQQKWSALYSTFFAFFDYVIVSENLCS